MADRNQVLRFAVGTTAGPRSRTWRLWVDKGKSDVYVSGRRLGWWVKVSLHERDARFALTRQFVEQSGFEAPEDKDWRLAEVWNWPRAQAPNRAVRPLALIVPWDEVQEREADENGDVFVWVPPPAEGMAIHFDVVYVPVGMPVTGHPGARSAGTQLVGMVELQNGERVYVTWLPREIDAPLRENIERLRSIRVFDAEGNLVEKTGMLGFGTEPNPDAADGTEVATLIDVTRLDEV